MSLPGLDVEWIKAKSDTGARSSSLHAFDLETFERDGQRWVRFEIHPWQRSINDARVVEVPMADERAVKSSSGRAQLRPVIRTVLRINGIETEIDLTLTRRDEMGFRMLLGREALRGRFVVDPGRSYLTGRPPRAVHLLNRAPDDPESLDDTGPLDGDVDHDEDDDQ